MNQVQLIFSGLVATANLIPCSQTSDSFVGIYASTSPGKKKKKYDTIKFIVVLTEKNWGKKKMRL